MEPLGSSGGADMRMEQRPGDPAVAYLDHAGAALPTKAQLRAMLQELESAMMGNPHSTGIASSQVADVVDQARALTFDFFGASSREYDVIFTSGATASARMVGEYFPWGRDSIFAHAMNSHTSILGIRAVAPTTYCLPSASLEAAAAAAAAAVAAAASACNLPHGGTESSSADCLLALPAECNFGGRRLRLTSRTFSNLRANADSLLRRGHLVAGNEVGPSAARRWWILLDAAKYAATHRVNLSLFEKGDGPDFVCVSFYKILGYPTGLGALIGRREALSRLNKRYFGGGTVLAAIPLRDMTILREEPHERFEDGTLNFQGIAALRHGFRSIEHFGGMDAIQEYTHDLSIRLYRRMRGLLHSSGISVCEIYGWQDEDAEMQGPIITFNLQRADGTIVGYAEVARLAAFRKIQLRTGCFCNPGGCQSALGLDTEALIQQLRSGHVCLDEVDVINGRHTGAVRVSLGSMSLPSDIEAFMRFLIEEYVDKSVPPVLASHLSDRSDAVPGNPDPCSDAIFIEALYVYPIKSCAGMKVASWPLRARGLAYDREWAVVDAAGRAIRMKIAPKMSQIRPYIDLRAGCLIVTATGMNQLRVPLAESHLAQHVEQVKVCSTRCLAVHTSEECDQWFTTFLGMPCRLVRHYHDSDGTANCNVPTGSTCRESARSFVNEQQFLVISRASVDNLCKIMQQAFPSKSSPVQLESFRPNLVISGSLPHVEDHWKAITLGAVDARTLQTLAGYRREEAQIYFGQFFGYDVATQTLVEAIEEHGHSTDALGGTGTGSKDPIRVLGPLQLRVGQTLQTELKSSHPMA